MPRLIVLLALLALPGLALADPITIVATLAPYIGGTLAAGIATVATFAATYGTYIALGVNVFNAYRARRAAKKANAEARRAYNASLKDRTITGVQQEPPERYFYGAGITGGDVVAIFTSDKVKNGKTKRDGYKHLVVIVAAHRIKSIKDILIGGVRLGITGSTGWATATEFSKSKPYDVTNSVAAGSPTYVISGSLLGMIALSIRIPEGGNVTVPAGGTYGYSLSGNTITFPTEVLYRGQPVSVAGGIWYITYKTAEATDSTVYAEKFLGTSTQTANAYLMGKVPSKWLSSDRLRGRAGVVITLDLEDPQFQGGLPQMTFDIEGRDEIYDPRTGTTGYTNNAALCIDDWLRSTRWGFGVVPDTASTIEAANACDVSTEFNTYTYPPDGVGPPTIVTTYEPRYTINGAFTAADDKDSVLSTMAAAMAGRVVDGADWYIQAGAWTVPVRDLVDGDEAGPVQIIQAGEAMDEIFNSVRATYIPRGQASTSDLWPPYSNSTFVTADGAELWDDAVFPFTDHPNRVRNLARITTEVARNGLTVQYPAKLKAWDLRVGQRVRVSNAEFGWTLKHFRITDWQFSHTGAVILTLIEDGEDAWDNADASTADPTPNTGLPNPYVVAEVENVTADSGTGQLLRLLDGTLVPRVLLEWDASEASYTDNGYIEIAWRTTDGVSWTVQNAGALDTSAYIIGAPEFQTLVIRVTAVNGLGARSADVFLSHYVLGKGENPLDVTGLAATPVLGGAQIRWDASTEADYRDTELRVGANWDIGTPIFIGSADTYGWGQPSPGVYTVWAKHNDTSGNSSTTAASATVTVEASGDTLLLDVSATAFVVPANSSGVVSSYAGASGTVKVFASGTDVTADWTLSRTDGTGVTSTLSGGTLTLTALASGTDSSYIDVTATRTGYVTLTRRVVVTKVRQGANGSNGSNGTRTARPEVYQWAASAPAVPGSSTFDYTWATGAVSSTPAGWSLTPGSSPSPGYVLYVASVTISNTSTTPTTSANWNTATVSVRGSSGANGARTAKPEIFHWATASPGVPGSTVFDYTWATGAVSAVPAGWTLTPGESTIPGSKLWAVTVTIVNTDTSPTTAANWNTGVLSVRGSDGFDGTRGTITTARLIAGSTWSDSEANTAIAAVSGGTPINSDTVTLYNGTSYSETRFYSAGSWIVRTSYINGNLLVDGTVQAAKIVTTSLSALSANLGTVTAGSISGVAITGGTVTGTVVQTATSGQRVIFNESSTNSMRLYADGGAGVELIANIAPASYNSVSSIARFGSITSGNSTTGVNGVSNSGRGVRGDSTSGTGVAGFTSSSSGSEGGVRGTSFSSAPGVGGTSSSGPGGYFTGSPAVKCDNGGISLVMESVGHDPYGAVGVTRGTASSYSYYGMTRSGQIGVGIGIDTSNRVFIGNTTGGHSSTLSLAWMTLIDVGMTVRGGFGCNGKAYQTSYSLSAAATDEASAITLVNQIRQALINNGICQ